MQPKTFFKAKWGIFVGILGIAVVLIVYLVISMSNTSEIQVRRALEMGERYLLTGEYEQAIVEFDTAIEIADRKPELLSLGDEARENRNSAAQSGATNLLQTPGRDLEDAVNWLTENGCLDTPSAYIFIDALSLLQDLEELCAAENYDAVFVLLADPAYKEIVSDIMGLNCGMALLNEETGLMTAIYRMEVDTENFADGEGSEESEVSEDLEESDEGAATEDAVKAESGNYMVYYGAHSKGIRNGDGVWLAYQDGNNYLATGNWTDDLPNGRFETRSWQADLNATVNYRVIIGEVVDGLWNGQVTWRFERGDTVDEYYPSFSDGVWQIIREENGFAIAAENADGGILIAAEPEKRNGIAGYAEAA